jgi:hypothetical protein
MCLQPRLLLHSLPVPRGHPNRPQRRRHSNEGECSRLQCAHAVQDVEKVARIPAPGITAVVIFLQVMRSGNGQAAAD